MVSSGGGGNSSGTNPICTHCGSTKSPLWRRGLNSEILCNACGLYWKHHGTYRPLSLKAAADRKEASPRAKSPVDPTTLPAKRESTLRRLKSALAASSGATSDGSIARKKMTPLRSKTSTGKIAIPSTYFLQMASGRWRGPPIFAPELPPSTGTANARLVPAEIRASAELEAPILYGEAAPVLLAKSRMTPVKYIMFRGRLLFIGDHVAIRGDDSQVYFAIVHDFWIVPTGQKYVHFQWLLPKIRYALEIDGPREKIHPNFFTLGPMHNRAEHIESIVDVFFSPQLLRGPLDGPSQLPSSTLPTTPLPQVKSRLVGPLHRSGSFDGGNSSKEESSTRSLSSQSGIQTPLLSICPIKPRPHSDSELELSRPDALGFDRSPPNLLRDLSYCTPTTSILDDVEMAHLLCNMS